VSRNDPSRDSDYMLKSEARVRSVRRDAENAENVTTVGYTPGSDQTRAFPGDEKFPFVKDVPDVTGPTLYRKSIESIGDEGLNLINPLPSASSLTSYETLSAVDVRGHRAFALFGIYFPAVDQQTETGLGLLNIIAEASLEPIEASSSSTVWYPIGVVDPVLNAPAIAPGYAYRRFFASEFRLDPWAGYVPPAPFPPSGPVPFTLVFDVSWYREIRIRCAELVSPLPRDGTFLQLNYMRMR